jgi:3-oxoacyl-[acyl-carrier-protein] synthase-3
MPFLTISNVKIVGVSACVPPDVEENLTLHVFENETEARKVIDSTGIARKRVVRPGTTSSDLSVPAIQRLLASLEWSPDSVDCLVFVSQTRDYIAPITSAILQDRLGFRNDCYCVDMPLGCSGWIYGMSSIASLLSHGDFKRGLLVCAETNSQNRSARDKTVKPLFADAATVTALEFANDAEPMLFEFGVDGKGYKAVWAEYGGSRNPVTPESLVEREAEPGIWRKGTDMVVNGMDVFSFAIRMPPRSLENLITHFNIDTDGIDYLYLHQSNHYIDDRIRKKLKLPIEKVPYCLEDYGNTTCASIPLTMVACTAEELRSGTKKCLACGFGVGLAWGSMYFVADHLRAVEICEYEYPE